jgi:Ca2+-binding EF-hand superfamily protein
VRGVALVCGTYLSRGQTFGSHHKDVSLVISTLGDLFYFLEIYAMFTFHQSRRLVAVLSCVFALSYSVVSIADDVVSFATGGYASGLRSEILMKKMTNGTGMLTKDEWIAFHEKIFVMLDKKKTGVVDAKEFISASGDDEVATFATGGYARGLRTREMMEKIDTDRDGTISQAELTAYVTKLFDMMDTSTTHKGTLSKEDVMFATGGYNKHS